MFEVIIETPLGRVVSIETQAQANGTVSWLSRVFNSSTSIVDNIRVTVRPLQS